MSKLTSHNFELFMTLFGILTISHNRRSWCKYEKRYNSRKNNERRRENEDYKMVESYEKSIQELKDKIEEYKEKISEYKSSLKDIIKE